MRLITRHEVYRAYPELDRFGDEQCRRFVAAAVGRGRWRYQLLNAAIALACIGFVSIVTVVCTGWIDDRERTTSRGVISSLGVLFVIGPFIFALAFRDWRLRRRIRYILRTRGVCPGCRYTLVGLGVDASGMVTCPECSRRTEVDPSLGELATEQGRPVFRPSDDPLRLGAGFWTPRRRRILKRTAIALAVGIPLLLVVLAGSYEGFLRWQAARARAERPGPQALQSLVDKAQPPGDSGPDAWAILRDADMIRGKIDDDGWKNAASAAADTYPDFSLIYRPLEPHDEEEKASLEKSRDLALLLMDRYEAAGVFTRLGDLARATRARAEVGYSEEAMPEVDFTQSGSMRQWARILGARMRTAAQRDDPRAFAEAMDASLRIVWMLRMKPLLIHHLVAAACEMLTLREVRSVLVHTPDAKWILAIEGSLTRAPQRPGLEFALEGERVYALDAIGWVFSDPARVRWGQSPIERYSIAGVDEESSGWVGTYARNRDEAVRIFDDLKRRASVERWQRPASSIETNADLALIDTLVPAGETTLDAGDRTEVEWRGLRILAALESFRLTRGDYPAVLTDLAPDFIEPLPLDPYSGKLFGYLRVDPAADPEGRSFLLYSVGADRIDNGGHAPIRRHEGLNRGQSGVDFVINMQD